MNMTRGVVVAFALASAAVLPACSDERGDLRQWMAQQREQTRPSVTPLKEPAEYTPLDYTEAAAFDPFGDERLTSVLRRQSRTADAGAALIAPELNRRKQPLEAYPLDTMTMVGSLQQGDNDVALIRVDRLLYQVRVGEYLGQNYGLIKAIDENAVTLREIVQDAAGEWTERPVELELQEKT